MAMVLDAVSRWRKVEEATSATDTAPPIYLLDELAELANSSAEHSESLADHITKRLKQQSPVVKWKALRLVRHLCNKGCTTFQRFMQRNAASVRELVHFQGEKDPFKGDSLNQRVRDAAKETVEVLYSSTSAPPSSGAMANKGRIQGFGSGAAGGPPAFSSDSSASYASRPQATGRMVGFGSDGRTHAPQPSSSATDLTSTVTSAVNSLGSMIRSQLPMGSSREHTSALHQRTGSYGDGGYVGFGTGDAPTRSAAVSSGGLRAQPLVVTSVLGSEEQLVGDICAPVGIRAAPDPEDLRKFVELASNMDGLRIGELLIEKMVVLRALYALEAVLVRGSSQACGEVAVLFQSDPSPVTRALSSSQLREKAAACLKLLLNEDAPEPPAMSAVPSARPPVAFQAAAAAPPFMDFGTENDQPQPVAAAPAVPLDLLGALDEPVPAVATTPVALHHSTAPVAQPADPFGGLNMGSLHAPSPSPPTVASLGIPTPILPTPAASAAPAEAAGPLDDFFASLSIDGGHQPPAGPSPSAVPLMSTYGGMSTPMLQPGHSPVADKQYIAQGYQQAGSASAGGLGMLGGAWGTQPVSATGGLGMQVPLSGVNGTAGAAKWTVPQAAHAGAAASTWLGPQSGSQSQQKGSDSAFDFVNSLLK